MSDWHDQDVKRADEILREVYEKMERQAIQEADQDLLNFVQWWDRTLAARPEDARRRLIARAEEEGLLEIIEAMRTRLAEQKTQDSWRRAWKGPGQPVQPFEDTEWVERRREWLESLRSSRPMSDEEAAKNYRIVQAQWMIDHLEELEEVDPELAAEVRRISEKRG